MNRAIATMPSAALRLGQVAYTVGLGLLLWHAADGPAILQALAKANLAWLAAAITALLCQTVLSAWRWRITAGALGQTLPLPRAIREYFLSQAINQALPGGVLGDATRAVRARSEVGLGISGLAVGIERLAGQIAMLITLAVAFAATYLWSGGLDWPKGYAGPVGLSLVGVIIGTTAATLLHKRFRLLGTRASEWVDLALHALLSKHVLPAQIGLGAAITICNVTAFGFCAWAVGIPLSLAPFFAIVPIILFTMLIPLTVSGWGVREGSAALLLPMIGATVPDAVAASVLFGISMLIAAATGLILMVIK